MCTNCQQNNNIFTPNGVQGLNGGYGGYSSAWLFDGSSISSSVANEFFRFNNTNISLVTSIYINKTNRDNIDMSVFLSTFSDNGNFGKLRLFKEFDTTTFADFKITAVSLSGNIYTLNVIYIMSNNTFTTNDNIVISYTPNGNISSNSIVLLSKVIGFNMNTLSDQTITLSGGSLFVVTDVVLTNTSTSLTTALNFGIWTGTTQTGKQICSESAGLVNLTTSTDRINGNIKKTSAYRNYIDMNPGFSTCSNTIYGSILTAQGATATVDIYIYGYILS